MWISKKEYITQQRVNTIMKLVFPINSLIEYDAKKLLYSNYPLENIVKILKSKYNYV